MPVDIVDQWHMSNFGTKAYARIIKRYGLKPFRFDLPDDPAFSRRGLILGQQNFNSWYCAAKNGKAAVVQGFALSGPLHLGSLSSLMQVAYYQKHFNAEIYIPLSDLEAVAVRRVNPNIYNIVVRYLAHFKAAGVDITKAQIYLQSRNPRVIRLTSEVVKALSYRDFRLLYGRHVTLEEIYGSLLTISDILLPYTHKIRNCLVASGIDEINTFHLIGVLIDRMKLNDMSFAATYSKTIPGINVPKMGKSVPWASITLDDNPHTVREKLRRSKSENLSLDRNPAFNLLLWYADEDGLIARIKGMEKHDAYRASTRSAIDTITAFLESHQKRYREANKTAMAMAERITGKT